jgi:hypothetical protein
MGVSDRAYAEIGVHVTLLDQGKSTAQRENQMRRTEDLIEATERLISFEANEIAVTGRISESVSEMYCAIAAILAIRSASWWE